MTEEQFEFVKAALIVMGVTLVIILVVVGSNTKGMNEKLDRIEKRIEREGR